MVPWPIILPHEILACMFKDYPNEFGKFVIGLCSPVEFWTGMTEEDPRLRNHPVTRIKDFKKRAVPMKLHGDGVPVGKAKGLSMDVISLSPLLSAPWPDMGYQVVVVCSYQCHEVRGERQA